MEASRTIGVEHPRCPYCHEAVVPGDERKQSCNACMAWHHEECWSLHGGCSACNRDRAGATRPRPPAGKAGADVDARDGEKRDDRLGEKRDAKDGEKSSDPASGPAVEDWRPALARPRSPWALRIMVVLAITGATAGAILPRIDRSKATAKPSRWLEKMMSATTEEEKTRACREGAEEGDPGAMNFLGHRLAGGIGCAQNDVEAVQWGKRAADRGNIEACYGVAMMYENGRGVRQSDEEAARWYRRAIAGGDTLATGKLAQLLARRPDLR